MSQQEVAMFVDFENLRYSLYNNYGQEPDIPALVEKAKKHGRPTVMRAYADFSEHPKDLEKQLHLAGIDVINVLVKKRTLTVNNKSVERIKNAADMYLALDAIIEARQSDAAGKQKVFMLVTGDRDYIKLVTHLKNIFGQRVVIVGVPECIAHDLEVAAGETDHIAVAKSAPTETAVIKRAFVAMLKKGPSPLAYWSLTIIDRWGADERQGIPGTAIERRKAISELIAEGILTTETIDRGTKGKATQAVFHEDIAKTLGYL